MGDNEAPPNPQLSGDEPSLGGEDSSLLTGFEPSLSSIPRTITDLPEMLQVQRAEMLIRIGEQPANQLLYRILLGSDASASLAAAQALGRLRDSGALDALARVIRNPGADASVRAAALQSVGYIGGQRGLSVLLDAKNDPDPKVREARVRALGNVGPHLEEAALRRKVIGALQTAFNDDDPFVREVSVSMLSWIGGEETHAVLLYALMSPHQEVVRTAARVLPAEGYTRLERLRRCCRVFWYLPFWLIRAAGHPTLIETLILTVVIGLLSQFIPWAGVFEKIQAAIGQEGQAAAAIVRIALALQLTLGGFAIAVMNRHRLNKQLPILHITKSDRGMLRSGYILASLYRTRVWFAGMIGVLSVAWPVIATEFLEIPAGVTRTAYSITLWSGMSVLVVVASGLFMLSAQGGTTSRPAALSFLKLFFTLTFVIPMALIFASIGTILLVDSTPLSPGESLIVVVVLMLIMFWGGKSLINRFRRRY